MSGWPWPLDAVQAWFDDLWGWIGNAAESAVKVVAGWINNSASWLWNQILNVGNWIVSSAADIVAKVGMGITSLGTTLGSAITNFAGLVGKNFSDVGAWIYAQVSAAVDASAKTFEGFSSGLAGLIGNIAAQISKGLGDLGSWLGSTVWGWIDGALRWATDSFAWLNSQLQDVGSNLVNVVNAAVGGVGEAVASGLGFVFGPVIEGATNFFNAVGGLAAGFDPSMLLSDVQGGIASLMAAMTEAFTPHSPRDPGEAFNMAWNLISQISQIYMVQTTTMLAVEAVSLGQIDTAPAKFLDTPQLQAGYSLVQQLFSTMNEAALIIPLRQHMMRAFTPNIPGAGDLISFVVREVIPPEKFYEYMPLQGFSREIAGWYWEAHWVLPGINQLYTAFHRGIISRDELDKYIVLHDFKPEPRPGIAKSDQEIVRGIIKTLIPRVDIRYAWEGGMISDEELTARYEGLGYEEDSGLMAQIQIARTLTEEIGKVRTEWLTDFTDGYIDEGTLRANLEVLGILGARQDYYVLYAVKRRDRNAAKKRLGIYHDAYLKDLITDEEIDTYVREILVDPDAIDVFLQDSYTDKYKKPAPPKAETVKTATLAYLTNSYRSGIIAEADLRAELERRLYTAESIGTILAVENLKKTKAAGE